MEIQGENFSDSILLILGFVAFIAFLLAVKAASWQRLADRSQLNGFLGTCVVLMILWSLRTEVFHGVEFHLLFMTTLTLMFGWSLAVIGGSIILSGTALAGMSSWSGLPVNFLVTVVLPVSFTYVFLILIRHWFPKHFFIYVYLNAFLVGGLSIVLAALSSAVLMSAVGYADFYELWDTYLAYFPLMLFPEAVLNGWFMTLLVCYRPDWVSTFRDREYLQGK